MKTTLRKVYQCEHCKRNMVSASAMSRHERFCRMNPNNKHKCFDLCRHLKRNIELIDGKDPSSAFSYVTTLKCGVTDIKMYSYLFEKKGNFKPEFLKGLIRMPLDCKLYQYMTDSEYEDRFHPSSDSDY
jgi:hypothetical protein